MKTIGLIGGMSWESSAEYYKIINETVRTRLGGMHSCQCLMYSFDFGEIEQLQHLGRWEDLAQIMTEAALNLEKAGAQAILICTNTMHMMADEVQAQIQIPIIHIADATAEVVQSKAMSKVALLGTKFTMEEAFYKERIKENYDIDVIIPSEEDRQRVHDVIYKELVQGIISPKSRNDFKIIIGKLMAQGAEGVILGCTEIPLLIKEADSPIPIFDTTTIHATRAVDFALS